MIDTCITSGAYERREVVRQTAVSICCRITLLAKLQKDGFKISVPVGNYLNPVKKTM